MTMDTGDFRNVTSSSTSAGDNGEVDGGVRVVRETGLSE